MQISKHISYNEAVKSDTAVKLKLENKPDNAQLTAMKLVAEKVFEPLREYLRESVLITSFFRSSQINQAVRGSRTSQHVTGEAIDMQALLKSGYTNADIFYYIRKNLDFDQLIWEFGSKQSPAWVHVSYSAKNNRKEVLQAIKQNGKTIYKQFI